MHTIALPEPTTETCAWRIRTASSLLNSLLRMPSTSIHIVDVQLKLHPLSPIINTLQFSTALGDCSPVTAASAQHQQFMVRILKERIFIALLMYVIIRSANIVGDSGARVCMFRLPYPLWRLCSKTPLATTQKIPAGHVSLL